MPTPVGTVRYRPSFASSLAAGAVACWVAILAAALSFSTAASSRPPALILALISSASFCHRARVSFSLGSRVISMALALFAWSSLPVSQLRDRDRKKLKGEVNDRDQVRDYQDDILRHLGPGHGFHAAEHRAEEHADQADKDTDVEV